MSFRLHISSYLLRNALRSFILFRQVVLGRKVDILKQWEVFKIEKLNGSVLEDNQSQWVVIELHELHTLDEVISHASFRS